MTVETWMGEPIDTLSRDQLADALKATVRLLRAVPSAELIRPEVEIRETQFGTVVGRAFKWAFIPAGQLWSDVDRHDAQNRLDAFAARHGLQGAVVHFGPDRLDVQVPHKLQFEQIIALQQWLEAEREAPSTSHQAARSTMIHALRRARSSWVVGAAGGVRSPLFGGQT